MSLNEKVFKFIAIKINQIMKLAHKIKISVFCSPEKDEEKIRNSLISLIPFNLENEKVDLKETKAKGFNEKLIKILEIELEKEKHTAFFLKNLSEMLNEKQKELLIRQIKSRLDDNLHFFIRLDKEKFLKNELFITDSGNCFHIKISIAAFPAKKEKGIEIVKEIFGIENCRTEV